MTATAYDPREKLTADIERAGFYPDLVRDIVDEALAGLEPESHFVQVETHFSHNNLHRKFGGNRSGLVCLRIIVPVTDSDGAQRTQLNRFNAHMCYGLLPFFFKVLVI